MEGLELALLDPYGPRDRNILSESTLGVHRYDWESTFSRFYDVDVPDRKWELIVKTRPGQPKLSKAPWTALAAGMALSAVGPWGSPRRASSEA